MRGTVKFYNADKGFGFVTRDDGERDVFVGSRVVEACGLTSLREGQCVEFEIGLDRLGRQAIDEIEILP